MANVYSISTLINNHSQLMAPQNLPFFASIPVAPSLTSDFYSSSINYLLPTHLLFQVTLSFLTSFSTSFFPIIYLSSFSKSTPKISINFSMLHFSLNDPTPLLLIYWLQIWSIFICSLHGNVPSFLQFISVI